MKKIILLGYMGCGKSTIAKKLSQIINIPFVDLDKCIEIKTHSTINKIFEIHGEIYFRNLERNVLIDLLESPENMIISLGGGTPCYANNHELLKGKGIVSIYLRASVTTLFWRLVNNKNQRPIVARKNTDDLKEFIAKHLLERNAYYNEATYKIDIDNQSIDETVASVLKILT